MGWSSGGDIFNGVAKALVELGADERIKRGVLGPLIDSLRDGDWDTEDESMQEFRDDPVIVELFVRRLGTNFYANGVWGGLDFTDDRWVLNCSVHGDIATGAESADEHDRLVREWASHDATEHGGDGVVDESLLITRLAAPR